MSIKLTEGKPSTLRKPTRATHTREEAAVELQQRLKAAKEIVKPKGKRPWQKKAEKAEKAARKARLAPIEADDSKPAIPLKRPWL